MKQDIFPLRRVLHFTRTGRHSTSRTKTYNYCFWQILSKTYSYQEWEWITFIP